MYCRLILRSFYQRICLDNPPLPLFLTTSNKFVPLRSALFTHASVSMLVEGFVTRYSPLFQVPQVIADDLLICGIVEPIAQAHTPNAPPISSSVCTPHEFRRLLRVHQGILVQTAAIILLLE
jgi:hypothetical protein